mgnify:FL=1
MYHLEQRIWTSIFVWFAVFLCTAAARADTDARIVHVATTSCPPFVIVDGDTFRGLSIFLWDEIARSLDVEYEIQEYTL